MTLDDMYFTMQVCLNFLKDNEISFDTMEEAKETVLEIINEMQDEKIESLDYFDEEVIEYMEEILQKNFIFKK